MRMNTATKANRLLPAGGADISCYENLANAIIVQAVKDYKAELHKLLKNPHSKEAMGKAMDIEGFFHSLWYATLSNVDPDFILNGVRKQVKEEAEIKRRRRMQRLRREAIQLQNSMEAAPHGAASALNGADPPLKASASPMSAPALPLATPALPQDSMPRVAAGVLCAD